MSKLADADTLKESMTGACNIFEKHGIDTTIARALISIIDSILCVDAEPVRHGRWVYHEGGYSDHYECTVCGESFVLTTRFRYCPNCGAKMDGDKSEID